MHVLEDLKAGDQYLVISTLRAWSTPEKSAGGSILLIYTATVLKLVSSKSGDVWFTESIHGRKYSTDESAFKKSTISLDDKDAVIKWMLTRIKKQRGLAYVLEAISELRNLGLKWPELDIIEKSADSSPPEAH